MAELQHWNGFYVTVASAAGALIGLQFVVMTLIAERPPPRVVEGSAAFGTPTIVHFSAALLVSATLLAPWPTLRIASVFPTIFGVAGALYAMLVARRMYVQGAYEPDWEDWLFHGLLPFAAYGIVATSALLTSRYPGEALFGIGGGTLFLLFIGIHNAWDSVAYHVFVHRYKAGDRPRRGQGSDAE